MLADGDVGSFDAVLLINQAAIIILNKAAFQKYARNFLGCSLLFFLITR